MTWTEQVQSNRLQVARALGPKPSKRGLGPPPPSPPSNSGLGSIAVVAALLGGALYWSKEGHKLRERRLPPFLEKLRSLMTGGMGRSTGSRRHTPTGPAAAQLQAQAQEWRQQAPRSLAAAAAEQRHQQQRQQQQVRGLGRGAVG